MLLVTDFFRPSVRLPVCGHQRPLLLIEDTGGAVGIDRNCGQVAMVSTEGDTSIIRQPDTKRLDAKLKRHQRKLARQKKGSNRRNRRKHRIARIQRKRANILKNANHQDKSQYCQLLLNGDTGGPEDQSDDTFS